MSMAGSSWTDGEMSYFVAVTDSPHGDDLSIERTVLAGIKVEKVVWQDEASLIEALAEADGVLCMHAPMTAGVVRRLPHCRVIATFGTGLDNIDVDAARDENIFVSGVDDYCTEEVANHTMALILSWNRKLLRGHRFVIEKRWNERTHTTGNWGFVPIHRLSEQTLGLIGFGFIGRAVARRATAFGMEVLVYSRHPDQNLADRAGIRFANLDEVLKRSDFVSLHIPLTDQTRHFMNAVQIGRMKQGAVLVNTARGALVDDEALFEALRSDSLGGALIDVYQKAPLPVDHPLREMGNVILTPHMAFYSEGALNTLRRRASEIVRDQLGKGS